jgi:aerobic carbon-monoxide dehydrogenase medium subunit
VIPAPFEYRSPESIEEAISLLQEHGEDAKLLAGGHSLLPLMKLRLATPAVLIDLGRIPGLSYVRDEGGRTAIGAMTPHADVERAGLGFLSDVAGVVGDPQVRNRGTIGGSLAHGDPASDLPCALLALEGTLVAQGPDGRREIPVASFFKDFLETALRPDEVIVEVVVPATQGGYYQKFNKRASDWAIVGAAAVKVDGSFRVALTNMGATPIRATAVEEALAGGASISDAAQHASDGTSPSGDINATPEYRQHLARVLTRRALEAASALR